MVGDLAGQLVERGVVVMADSMVAVLAGLLDSRLVVELVASWAVDLVALWGWKKEIHWAVRMAGRLVN